MEKILQGHQGELDRLSGRSFGPFELLASDFTELRYRQGTRKGWLAAFYDPAGRAWQQVRSWYGRWEKPLQTSVVHDQDAVFKSYRWLLHLLCQDQVEVSYSERGAKDNPWIESLWSRLKDEVGQLLFEAGSLSELQEAGNDYFTRYIHQRRHQSLNW